MDVTEPVFNKPVARTTNIYMRIFTGSLKRPVLRLALLTGNTGLTAVMLQFQLCCNGGLPGTRQNMESKQTLSVALRHGAAAVRLVRCCSLVTRRTQL